jgi:hypothetical protein
LSLLITARELVSLATPNVSIWTNALRFPPKYPAAVSSSFAISTAGMVVMTVVMVHHFAPPLSNAFKQWTMVKVRFMTMGFALAARGTSV